MDFQEALLFLYNSLPMYQRLGPSAYKKDLTNTVKLCQTLGNPHLNIKSIHIAGTNGKGSVAHSMAAVLQICGYKIGLYTSPHLKSFTERIRVNGQVIIEDEVTQFVSQNLSQLMEIKPSFFEMSVAMAFDHFSRNEVDYALVEVGLGGRLDSTNIISPILSVITNIGLDHQDMLGETLPEIAAEKAGIIKPQVPVVISEHQEEVAMVFETVAKKNSAPIFFASENFKVSSIHQSSGGKTFRVEKHGKVWATDLSVDLVADYQERNLPGVLQALEKLKELGLSIEDKAITQGLSKVVSLTGIKGRWQTLGTNPLTICDSGHNIDAFKLIIKQIRKISYNRLFIVYGTVKGKSIDPILGLFPRNAYYYFTEAHVPRALDAYELSQMALAHGLRGTVIREVNQAVQAARSEALPNDLIFIGGSMFIVAEINEL